MPVALEEVGQEPLDGASLGLRSSKSDALVVFYRDLSLGSTLCLSDDFLWELAALGALKFWKVDDRSLLTARKKERGTMNSSRPRNKRGNEDSQEGSGARERPGPRDGGAPRSSRTPRTGCCGSIYTTRSS